MPLNLVLVHIGGGGGGGAALVFVNITKTVMVAKTKFGDGLLYSHGNLFLTKYHLKII